MLMKKLFEAAFRPPSENDGDRCVDGVTDLEGGGAHTDGATSSRAGAGRQSRGGYAVLPRQSEDELRLSEVHSHLDRALNFLQLEIGYSLLEDARPQPGGGLKLHRRRPVGPGEAVPRGMLSTKCPSSSSAAAAQSAPKKDDAPEELEEERLPFNPRMMRYAHFPDDILLVRRYAGLLAEAADAAMPKVHSEQLHRAVLSGVRLMHLCQYDYSDVVLTLAYASVYFQSTYELIGDQMSNCEVAHVSVLLIYLAHTFILDETCPLRHWQKHIFRRYCTLKVLDAALFRLFRMRKFDLRITEEQEKKALSCLLYEFDPSVVEKVGSSPPSNASGGETAPCSDATGFRVPSDLAADCSTADTGSAGSQEHG
eukprot:TRINITY_DN9368_c0_g1_i1.p1 TRINITY_DN9368_c0_g1~~TRINITY_DN9368_c0_g1_i1.p1  ORF type:complete len:368 (+),score=61.45 TRINITY_DN9368_c0_g1_i1:206-1309(+)